MNSELDRPTAFYKELVCHGSLVESCWILDAQCFRCRKWDFLCGLAIHLLVEKYSSCGTWGHNPARYTGADLLAVSLAWVPATLRFPSLRKRSKSYHVRSSGYQHHFDGAGHAFLESTRQFWFKFWSGPGTSRASAPGSMHCVHGCPKLLCIGSLWSHGSLRDLC